MKWLSGRTALITGSSVGIGLAIARELAGAGMNLVLAARTKSNLEQAAEQVRQEFGVQVLAVPTDVSLVSQLRHLTEAAHRAFGSIDVLVNNAGREDVLDFERLELEDIEQTVRVNLTATLQLTRLVVPHMRRSGSGHIVNIASIAGKHGPAYAAVYAASKAGQIAFTQSLRAELLEDGICASVICPGCTIDSGMSQSLRSQVRFRTPWFWGWTTTDAVARAVRKAILRNTPEVIVNSMPWRPIFVLAQVVPRLASWLLRIGNRHYFHKVAVIRGNLIDDQHQRAAG